MEYISWFRHTFWTGLNGRLGCLFSLETRRPMRNLRWENDNNSFRLAVGRRAGSHMVTVGVSNIWTMNSAIAAGSSPKTEKGWGDYVFWPKELSFDPGVRRDLRLGFGGRARGDCPHGQSAVHCRESRHRAPNRRRDC